MTTYRFGLEQLRHRKRPLSLWFALMSLLITIAALTTLDHDGAFTALKAVYLAVDIVILCLTMMLRSIRASVVSFLMLLVMLTM